MNICQIVPMIYNFYYFLETTITWNYNMLLTTSLVALKTRVIYCAIVNRLTENQKKLRGHLYINYSDFLKMFVRFAKTFRQFCSVHDKNVWQIISIIYIYIYIYISKWLSLFLINVRDGMPYTFVHYMSKEITHKNKSDYL